MFNDPYFLYNIKIRIYLFLRSFYETLKRSPIIIQNYYYYRIIIIIYMLARQNVFKLLYTILFI